MSWDKVRRAQMRWSVECEECSVKCGAWRVQCEAWSVKKAMRSERCEVWTVKCEVWSVKCEVWIGKSAVWSEKCGVWSVKCAVWSVKSAVRSVKGEVEIQMWHVKQDTTFAECTHARAWLAHGACKFYRWERSYIYTISIALWAKSRFSGKIQVLNFVTRILNGTIENRVLGYLQDQCGDNGSIKKPFWLTQCWDGIYRFHWYCISIWYHWLCQNFNGNMIDHAQSI